MFLEAATGGILLKKVFLENSQNLQENTCAKKRLCHRCFSVNFAKILRLRATASVFCVWVRLWNKDIMDKVFDRNQVIECTEAVSQRCYVRRCSLKFRKIHRKTLVPESLFSHKVANLRSVNLLKKRFWHSFSYWTPPVAASECKN